MKSPYGRWVALMAEWKVTPVQSPYKRRVALVKLLEVAAMANQWQGQRYAHGAASLGSAK